MNNLIALVIILTVATGAAGFVWMIWDAWKRPYGVHHDETQQCQRCGCGMVDSATGWQCPECRNIVEAERSAL